MPTFHLIRGEFQTEPGALEQDGEIHNNTGGTIGTQIKICYTDYFLYKDAVIALIQTCKCVAGDNLNDLYKRKTSDNAGSHAKVIDTVITADDWYIDAPGDQSRLCPGFGLEFEKKTEENVWERWQTAKGSAKGYGGDSTPKPHGVSSVPKGDDLLKARLGRVEKKEIDIEVNGKIVNRNTNQFTSAFLFDAPSRFWKKDEAFHHHFETAALCICSDPNDPLNGTVRGVLTWGYAMDEKGKWKADKIEAANRPSKYWVDAASTWNRRRGGRLRLIPGRSDTWSK